MVKRLDFGKTKEIFELPNLVEAQTNSYKEFLQLDVPKTKRENKGLQAVFNYIFPIESFDGKYKLEFVSYTVGRPKYSQKEARERDVSYAGPLKAKIRLRSEREVKEQDVYFGELPLMTEQGNFIINGDDRVVVNQLHRSPGVTFGETKRAKGGSLFSARIIPYRGSWIEFEFDKSNNLNVYIDRRRKFVFTTFLRALGYSTDQKILKVICGIEEVHIRRSSQWNKYIGKTIAEDIKDSQKNKIILPALTRLTKSIIKDKLQSYRGKKIKLIKNDFIEVRNSLNKDFTKSKEEALLAIYRKLRPGDPPTIESAKSLLNRMFFDPRRYDMSNIGWFIINRKFNTNFSSQNRELDKKVIIETIKYLLNLKNGKGEVDDIDHLGNRRVKTVGELLSNQIQVGLARVARTARERMNIYDTETMMPHNLINTKLVSSVIRDFFARGRLSQFMDQTNPLAETTHKRRLSALGPGGLSRERAGFEVRDVHQSHYGRICPIETPEGPNIGLITSLTTFAKVNPLGFLESPYRKVKNGKVTNRVEYLTADVENKKVIAPANAKLDSNGKFLDKYVRCRYSQDVISVPPKKIDYIDVSPRQIVSVDASLIPFLEHDDTNRALMGANMQRQAVPLLFTEPPLVGTGLEKKVAQDSGALIIAKNSGKVTDIEADKITVGKKEYKLKKFERSNANTCINQRPLVSIGDKVNRGDILADGPATKDGEISLGRNILVAFMSWHGHNFEDAILVSERLVKEDIYTSVHIEEFEIEARDTRLGAEEITRDIPNVGEEALKDLDEKGIVRIGAEVSSGDILVGKVTPKVETELTPEEKLLRAIFGEKAGDIRDASLKVPSGVEGVVIGTKVFSRKEAKSSRAQKSKERKQINKIQQEYEKKIKQVMKGKRERVAELIIGQELETDLLDINTGKTVIPKGKKVTKYDVKKLKYCDLDEVQVVDNKVADELDKVLRLFNDQLDELTYQQERQIDRIKRGDELPPGVIKRVVVYVASKRRLSVGDKMAGRHGNKGVIAKILPEEDMPFLPDGTPVDIVLNPLGVPSRMNIGQVLEAHLGWAAKELNKYISTPVFGGITEEEIRKLLKEAGLPEDGRITLYDGLTGEAFDQKVTVGYIYMMKLIHLADEKIHARSIGPYSLVTQQPLGGRAQYGGQRFGEMEVWALEAYGAAYMLQELLTVKSDDVQGRTKIYESIVKGDTSLKTGIPESFNVLIQELKGLGLDVRTERKSEDESEYTPSDEFDLIHIKIASPETIRSWSHGEIKKPETINYRTLKTEKDGLFCERIFGPTKDWECYCGKYKRIKHKGIICDRCGVEVTKSNVRRRRMGHIELASPVSHIWFFKAMPSKLGAILGMSIRSLERVLYYEEFIVIDPGESPFKKGELLPESKYREAKTKYGKDFKAGMGAEAIKELLERLDLNKLIRNLRRRAKGKRGKQVRKKVLKRLRIVEAFKKSGNKPEWMIMDVIPVIPPDLRPLVPLDGGRFATSDLNDLYRRVINRNNRLKKLLDLNAPEIIIRNEKRMLQEAVDALFDNGRHGRPVMGAGNRPLKSLSEMLKGKQGRFRQNLLGKRVDYSGRSVIVIGPELKLHQCGLPKKIALELFEPFIIKELKNRGHVHTIKSARKMVERTETEVWDILDEVIKGHPVLLNRAPTLHRLGIQAFQPVLVEGKAIKIHPLVCTPFNADFDGDQMAVHVPLSTEAKMEAQLIMLSSHNIFSPAHGDPIVTPTQDIVLGCYYLTKMKEGVKGEGKIFFDSSEVITAYEDGMVDKHAKIKVRINKELVETTVGRVLFNDILPKGMRFVNRLLNKSAISDVIKECYENFGYHEVVCLLDRIKEKGFKEATYSGASLAIDNLNVPIKKLELVAEANKKISQVQKSHEDGVITAGERYNKVVDIWTHVTEQVSDAVFKNLDKFNPLFMMADSGARGSKQQIRQLVGMRGLMAKPSGEIIESPIISSFREGLTSLEYFISTHGGRKGLADTALKTADSGYLTRRLIDVAQDVIIVEKDCGTLNGIYVEAIVEGDEIMVSLKERIVGRVACDNVVDVISDEIIVKAGDVITERKAERIQELGIEKIKIRSVLTCEASMGVCSKCYGTSLATGTLVELGESVGIIAAQSIGEPGTQLTMRTFHIGGTASRIVEQSFIKAKHKGNIVFHDLRIAPIAKKKWVVLNRNGQISINDEEGIELERHVIPQGAILNVKESDEVKTGDKFVEWDPYSSPILTEVEGKVEFEDIIDGKTSHKEVDEANNIIGRVIIEHSGDYHPQILILDKKNNVVAIYPLPAGAHITVNEREKVKAGAVLAKTPRKVTKTRDITGGLPRVAELFEARKPKDPAIISEIDGTVEFGKTKRGQRRVIVSSPTGMKREYLIPHGKHLNVYKGDKVSSGDRLTDGPVVPQDILRICGEKELQKYLLNEIQEVYRLQGVRINDKHIELIIRQMLKKVKVEDPGDTEFLIGQQVDKFQFKEENKRVKKQNKKPASASPLLLGITKASLTTESFISAASFQETTRVLTDAAASGKVDELFGLKENVIMGHLIPAGTGFREHRNIKIKRDLSSLMENMEEKKEDGKKEKSQGKKKG